MDNENIFITNNPIDIVLKTFKILYPDKKVIIQFTEQIKNNNKKNTRIMGITCFNYFKDDVNKVLIHISSEMHLSDTVDILIHELAHAVIDDTEDDVTGHGEEWEKVYDKIYDKYLEILEKYNKNIFDIN